MPIREYECLDCKNKFEMLLPRDTDMDKVVCTGCGSHELQRCFTFASNYKIKGDNSASTRPRKRMVGR